MEDKKVINHQEIIKRLKDKARTKRIIFSILFIVGFIFCYYKYCHGYEGFSFQSRVAELLLLYGSFAGIPFLIIVINIGIDLDSDIKVITRDYIRETEGEEAAQEYNDWILRDYTKKFVTGIALKALLSSSKREKTDKQK